MRFPLLLAVGLCACSGSDPDDAPSTDDAAAIDTASTETAADTASVEDTRGETTPDVGDATPEAAPPATVPFVYVGCGGTDIEQYAWDAGSGALTFVAKVNGGSNPSFLAVDPSRRFLYAVNESSSQVAAFAISKKTGALTFLNRVSSEGNGPAFVSVDPSGRFVLVANYGGGSVSVFSVGTDGKLGAKVSGASPGPKAHSILVNGKFAYVPTLGADAVFRYAFADGALSSPLKVASVSGAGPRHIAFAPGGGFAYVANELNDTVTAYAVSDGAMTAIQSLSSLPSGFDPSKNTGADVHVRPNGKTLYASNRGHDSIAIFDIGSDGKLGTPKHAPTGGSTPRNFHVDPAGERLLVANQGSANVVTFAIDASGGLSKLKTVSTCASPSFVGVVDVPE